VRGGTWRFEPVDSNAAARRNSVESSYARPAKVRPTGMPSLTPTPEALKTLYVVQPLPQKLERVRTRVWTSIKSDK